MTNYEAISARLYPYDVDDALIHISCMNAGLSPTDEYSVTAKKSVAKATIDVLKQLVVLPPKVTADSRSAIILLSCEAAFTLSQRRTVFLILPKSSTRDPK